MNTPKPFASLSPGLLARKGAARPAMRPQIQPLRQFHEATARQIEDDLGWNDMGGEAAEPAPVETAAVEAVAFEPATTDETIRPEADVVMLQTAVVAPPPMPEVVRQQEDIAVRLNAIPAGKRRSALAEGRRAAFTLRVDAERHLKLRLACVVRNMSAQQLVTEALDRLIGEMSEIEELSAHVRKRG